MLLRLRLHLIQEFFMNGNKISHPKIGNESVQKVNTVGNIPFCEHDIMTARTQKNKIKEPAIQAAMHMEKN